MGKRAQTIAFDKLLKVCKSILWRAKFTLLIFHLLWHRDLWKTQLLAALDLNRTRLQKKCLRIMNKSKLFSRNGKRLNSTGTCMIIECVTSIFTKKIERTSKECIAEHFVRFEEMSLSTSCKFAAILLSKQYCFIIRCFFESLLNPSQFCGLP